MILCGVYFAAFDDVRLLTGVQFFKINQYTLMAIFFYSLIARLQGQAHLLARCVRF